METADNLRSERKALVRTLVRNIIVKGGEFGHPILLHIPEQEIPDTPVDEFEKGIEEFFDEER
jgi:hypothetical protein